jgi:hypothetical protein
MVLAILGSIPYGINKLIWRQRNSSDYQKAWYQLAPRLGLTFEPGEHYASPRITGSYRGRTATLDLALERGDTFGTYTRVMVSTREAISGSFSLVENDFFGRIGALWNAIRSSKQRNIIFWRFEIISNPVKLGHQLLASTNLRTKLLQTPEIEVNIDGHLVILKQRGIVKDSEKAAFLIDLTSEITRLLEIANNK